MGLPIISLVVLILSWSVLDGFCLKRSIGQLDRKFNRNMFSGIVEDIGTIEAVTKNRQMKQWDGSVADGLELTVRSRKAIDDAYVGCSIAVNGVCLTATSMDDSSFTVGVSPETLRRSNLGDLVNGSPVNIERALGGRNSGHFVQGHVDCTGKILERWQEGDSLWFKVQIPRRIPTATAFIAPATNIDTAAANTRSSAVAVGQIASDTNVMNYIVSKGFICVDGTSLTVCDVHRNDASSKHSAEHISSAYDTNSAGWFTVMLVAHTQQHVIFPLKQVGDLVNIEVDIIGKLVEQSVSASIASLKDTVHNLALKDAQREKRITELERRLIELELASAKAGN